MVRSRSYGRSVEEERFSEPALSFGNTREPFQFLGIDDSEIKAGLCAVVEEDGIDDLAGSSGEAERDVRNSEDGFDVRDLLFDEAD